MTYSVFRALLELYEIHTMEKKLDFLKSIVHSQIIHFCVQKKKTESRKG